MNRKVFCTVVILLGFLAASVGLAAEPSIVLDKTSFAPGEKITVKFTAPKDYDKLAWIGIIPSKVKHGSEAKNDENDISYQYLNKKTKGNLTFSAPDKPGKYDFRMNDSDNNGSEVASVAFVVEKSPAKPNATAVLTLKKETFKPGEKVTVKFKAPPGLPADAWVGVIPSGISHGKESVNDAHDVSYQYLKNRTEGTLTFSAPQKGNWDLRMSDTDNNGKELTSVSFMVK